MRSLGQFQTFLFFEKISRVQKRKSTQNQPIFSLLDVFMSEKFLPLFFFLFVCLFNFILLVGFGLICVFVRTKSFCKKKKKNGLKFSK